MKKRNKKRLTRKRGAKPLKKKSVGGGTAALSKKMPAVSPQPLPQKPEPKIAPASAPEPADSNAPLAEKTVTLAKSAIEIAVVVSNLRVPFHDEKAIQLCLTHTRDLGVEKVIFDGDIIDFHRRSDIARNPLRVFTEREILEIRREVEARFQAEDEAAEREAEREAAETEDEGERPAKKKARKKISAAQRDGVIKSETMERALRRELAQCFEVMRRFRDAHPKAEIVWVYGCQEFYLAAYLRKYFPQLLGEIDAFCRATRIEQIFNETRNNIYNYGGLVVGHWFRGGLNSPSAFVAHQLLDDEGVSLIQGHTNRGGWACRTVEGQKNISAYENFSLCKRPIGKNWQLGYSIVYRERDKKRFQVFQVPIANYGFFWGEKEYRLDATKVGSWERAVSISDIHIPWEDSQALDVTFEFLGDFQPETILVNGDVNDFQDISRFSKSPLDILTDADLAHIDKLILESKQQNVGGKFFKSRLQREIEKIREFFRRLREICPKARIAWIFGNHEYRLQRYIEENAAALAGLRRPGEDEEVLSLSYLVRTKDFGIEIVYSGLIQSYTTYGGLLVGHFYKVCAKSAYTARNLLQQKHQSLLQPHVHRLGAHYKTNLLGKMMVAIEMGCLCRLDPQWIQNPNWQHGFAVIHKKKGSDRFYVQPVHIVDGAFLFGGKRYGRPSKSNPLGTVGTVQSKPEAKEAAGREKDPKEVKPGTAKTT